MSRLARGLLRWAGRAAIAVVLALVVMWLTMPPARDPASGDADPLLGARRPVMKALYALGVPRSFGAPDDWLPSVVSSTTWAGAGGSFETAPTATRTTLRSEPVYRGGVWRVGCRVTIVIERRGTDPEPVVDLVLWSEIGDVRTEIARGGPTTTDAATGVRRVEVRGFVDADAERFGWVETYKDGRRYDGESWSR